MSSGTIVTVSWSAPTESTGILAHYEVDRYRYGQVEETIQVSAGSTQVRFDSPTWVGTFTFTVTAVYLNGDRFESARSAAIALTATPTPSATNSRTPTPTPIPPTATRTLTATPSSTLTPSATPTSTATPSTSPTVTGTIFPTPSPTPTSTPSPSPSPTGTPAPTPWLTPAPTAVSTVAAIQPAALPTTVPTPNPTTGGVAVLVPTAPSGTDGLIAVITPAVGAPFRSRLEVPVGPIEMGVRLQLATEAQANARLPDGVLVGKVVAVDVFDPSTGQVVHEHPRPLRLTIELDEFERLICGIDPTRIAILHLDAAGALTRLVPTAVDCTAGTISADLHATSEIAIAILPNGTTIPFKVFLPLDARRATAR
jgi:hypothetical protein